jgi:hypothetical protein
MSSPQSPMGSAAELERPAACEVVGTDVGSNKKARNWPTLSVTDGGRPLRLTTSQQPAKSASEELPSQQPRQHEHAEDKQRDKVTKLMRCDAT